MRNARTDPGARSAPGIKAPPGACDTHVHLFGPTGKYPFASDSRYEARDALPETLIALQDVLGLSMAVIVSPAGYGRDTAMLADVLSKYPDRFRGIALMQLRRSGIYSVSRTIDDNRSTLEDNHRATYCNDAAYQPPAHAAAGG